MNRRFGRQRSTGQTLIEFALVLPIFLTIMFGIVEMGRLMNAWVTVRDIALDAAAVGSRPDPTQSRAPSEVMTSVRNALLATPWVSNTRDVAKGTSDFVTVDVNDFDGTTSMFRTRVRIHLSLTPLIASGDKLGIRMFDITADIAIPNHSTSVDGTSVARGSTLDGSGVLIPHAPLTLTMDEILTP